MTLQNVEGFPLACGPARIAEYRKQRGTLACPAIDAEIFRYPLTRRQVTSVSEVSGLVRDYLVPQLCIRFVRLDGG